MLPMARTPWDKKGSRSLNDFSKKFLKELRKSLTPWDYGPTKTRKRYEGAVKPGEVKVVLGPGEGDLANSIFKDSEIVKG